MAAGRFNIPAILVICGYQPSGHYKGKHVDIGGLHVRLQADRAADVHRRRAREIRGPVLRPRRGAPSFRTEDVSEQRGLEASMPATPWSLLARSGVPWCAVLPDRRDAVRDGRSGAKPWHVYGHSSLAGGER